MGIEREDDLAVSVEPRNDGGATLSGPGCQSFGPQPASPFSRSGIPSAVLDEVAFAIERAGCPGREGPFGGYDYGHNTDFYGPEPDGGRYVVRDFRDFRSPDWGQWVHQTACAEEHEQALLRLTGRHIAEAAIKAYAKAMCVRQDQDPQGLGGDSPASAVGNADLPDILSEDTTHDTD